jgi:uncharacterized membrane protein
VNGKILWANLHLLFWLSLLPYVTNWTGQYNFAPLPTALYGGIFIMAAFAYTILQGCIIRHQGLDSKLAVAVGNDVKGKFSIALYAAGILLSVFSHSWLGAVFYALVALMWLIPDPRIEKRFSQ